MKIFERQLLMKILAIAVIGLHSLENSSIAHAEGHQPYASWGVNRVVWTEPVGFYRVEGDFNVNFAIPTTADHWTYTQACINHGDRPTAYLGGKGTYKTQPGPDKTNDVMIDAGLQYERAGSVGGFTGWEAVILNSQAHNGFNQGMVAANVWDNSKGRMSIWLGGNSTANGKTGQISTHLDFEVHSGGGASLTVSAFGCTQANTFYWNSNPGSLPTADLGSPFPNTGEQVFDTSIQVYMGYARS